MKRNTYKFDIVDERTEQHLMYLTLQADYWDEAETLLFLWLESDKSPHGATWQGAYERTPNQLQDVEL